MLTNEHHQHWTPVEMVENGAATCATMRSFLLWMVAPWCLTAHLVLPDHPRHQNTGTFSPRWPSLRNGTAFLRERVGAYLKKMSLGGWLEWGWTSCSFSCSKEQL